jgi:uncharacterized protein (DUF885 family)
LAADLAELDPLTASEWGLVTDQLPEMDPDWWQVRRDLFAGVLRSLGDDGDAPALAERASAEVAWIDAGEPFAEVRAAMDAPLHRIRFCFDEMPHATVDHWAAIARRMTSVPRAVDGYRRTLGRGGALGINAPRRQVEATADALQAWVAGSSVFARLVSTAPVDLPAALGRDLDAAAAAATESFASMARFLRNEYRSADADAVGPERYELWSRRYAGTSINNSMVEQAQVELATVRREAADV